VIRLAVLAAVAAILPACDAQEGPRGVRGPKILPRDPNAPYVITAIDYHFHDAHPTPRLSPEREVIVSNQGRNLHNVTFEELGFSRDLEPGDRISLGKIGELLERPGDHPLVCVYHVDREMTGLIRVAG